MAPRHPFKIAEPGYDASADEQDALDRQHELERERYQFDHFLSSMALAIVNEIGPLSLSKSLGIGLVYETLEKVAREAARVPHAVRR